jgi:hypothetical protein
MQNITIRVCTFNCEDDRGPSSFASMLRTVDDTSAQVERLQLMDYLVEGDRHFTIENEFLDVIHSFATYHCFFRYLR